MLHLPHHNRLWYCMMSENQEEDKCWGLIRGNSRESKKEEACQDGFREEMTEKSRSNDTRQYILSGSYTVLQALCPVRSVWDGDMIELDVRDLCRQQVCCTWQKACGTLPEGRLMPFLCVPAQNGTKAQTSRSAFSCNWIFRMVTCNFGRRWNSTDTKYKLK